MSCWRQIAGQGLPRPNYFLRDKTLLRDHSPHMRHKASFMAEREEPVKVLDRRHSKVTCTHYLGVHHHEMHGIPCAFVTVKTSYEQN